ncbi:hypothetical protein CC86DRAFT_431686, partial [Ophiobolus disseminans]
DYCINQNIFYYWAAAVNIANDILIALIPIPELWKLNFSVRKKVLLSAVFGVGFMPIWANCSTIIVSCLRVQSLNQYANTTNPTYDTLSSGTWSVVELNVGVFCVCMPAFRRFLGHTMSSCFGSKKEDSVPVQDAARTSSHIGGSGGKRGIHKKSTLPDSFSNTGGSMFGGTTTKTIDTRVESLKVDEDELQLVELSRSGHSVAESTESGQPGNESLYKQQNGNTIPRVW